VIPARTYGTIKRTETGWVITDVEPQVALRLKSIFPRVPKGGHAPFELTGGTSLDADLSWFLSRYPLRMTPEEANQLAERKTLFETGQAEILGILSPDWKPSAQIRFRHNRPPYRYQQQNAELARRLGRLLIMDDIGLGKTVSALATIAVPELLPCAIVVPPHLDEQWTEDYIDPFTHLSHHIIKGTRPYQLPVADCYVFKYSNVFGWVDYFLKTSFPSVVGDELQDLRHGPETAKGRACKILFERAGVKVGLTASPVYNYADEMFQLIEFLEPGVLGTWREFSREWCSDGRRVANPQALGAHLRELNLVVRRLEDDPEVNKQMPPLNTIVETVPYDEDVAAASEDLARQLAMSVVRGSFHERGEAARKFDALMRHTTGVAKARHVAAIVRMLLQGGRKVIVGGWHRDVYDIWNRELAAYRPAMYTGTESRAAKKRAKRDFISGATDLMLLSIRSGTGLDGLQDVCFTAVVGELDWSPEVIRQFFGRVRRPGQRHQCDGIYVITDGGSDPSMVATLGVKSSQARGVRDPFAPVEQQFSDRSRIVELANAFLRGEHRQMADMPLATQTELFGGTS
jgi:hypothetical protein